MLQHESVRQEEQSTNMNIEGIVQSLTNDRGRMTEFLLRRTLPQTKNILLSELIAMIVEHESLAIAAYVNNPLSSFSFLKICQVFDSINGVLAALLHEGGRDATYVSQIQAKVSSPVTNVGCSPSVPVGMSACERTIREEHVLNYFEKIIHFSLFSERKN
jgi:hypothetical protein